ncbi:hypothetical protein [Rubrivirga sp. IMCC43871]|uniref:hypothetical protein n=1 Tax=Rubrivirga sp. IMCC43871 TaxID=3391575 RepID=UPI003990096B
MAAPPTPPPSGPPPTAPAARPRRWDWRPTLRWFAAEIVVVVAGVLIALALNAWWQGRQDHALETHTLRELRAALLNDLTDVQVNVGFHSRASASAHLLREHVRARGPYADTLDAHLGHILGATFTIRDEAAYETLKQRGMETISNDSVRVAIGRVYGVEYPRVIGFQQTATDFMLTQVFPFFTQRFRDLSLYVSATPVDYPSLLDSTEFAGHLDWAVRINGAQAAMMGTLEAEITALIALLDDELATR